MALRDTFKMSERRLGAAVVCPFALCDCSMSYTSLTVHASETGLNVGGWLHVKPGMECSITVIEGYVEHRPPELLFQAGATLDSTTR